MNGWTEKAVAAANSPRVAISKPLPAISVPPTPREAREPKEKHVRLPQPPNEPGPWVVGPFELRRTTTYLPRCRATLTGPDEDFDKLLAYLLAYQS